MRTGDGVNGAGAGTGVGDGDGGGVAGARVGVAMGEILGEAAGDCARHEVVNRASNNRIRQLEPIRRFLEIERGVLWGNWDCEVIFKRERERERLMNPVKRFVRIYIEGHVGRNNSSGEASSHQSVW